MKARALGAAALLLAVMSAHTTMSAVGSRKAECVGSTVGGMREPVEGTLDMTGEDYMAFLPDGGRGYSLMLPYPAITGLEYGPAAGRRLPVKLLVAPSAPGAKTRKHFLTITYRDETNQEQAAVYELGSAITRSTLRIVATRSGKTIHYQDDEARKAGRGGN
jgi:hypothetical protein